MPYLQIDLPRAATAEVKRRFAERLARIYAETMEIQPHIPSADEMFRDGRMATECSNAEAGTEP